MAFGRSDKAVSIAFEGKDNVSPVVRGIRSTMDGMKRDAKQGFGLAAGFSVMQAGMRVVGEVGQALGNMQQAYSNLNEAQTKNAEVFKVNGRAVEVWAEDAAAAFGLSQRAAIDAAASIGNFMQSLGVTEMEAASMSMGITGLAGDLASFNNVAGGAEEVLIALRSGLAGEAEPMRRLGVDISAAAVQAKALEMGLAGTAAELTQGMKVQARYAIIMEQTATAQGDFARTADGSANQARLLDAKVENLNAQMGGLVDTVVRGTQMVTIFAVDAIGGLITALDNLDGSVDAKAFEDKVLSRTLELLQEQVEEGALSIEMLPAAFEAAQRELERINLGQELLDTFGGGFYENTIGADIAAAMFPTPEQMEDSYGIPFEVAARILLKNQAALADLVSGFGPDTTDAEKLSVIGRWVADLLEPERIRREVSGIAEDASDEAAEGVAQGLVDGALGDLDTILPENLTDRVTIGMGQGIQTMVTSAVRDIDSSSIGAQLGGDLNTVLGDIFSASASAMDTIFGGFGGRIRGENTKTKRGKGSLYNYILAKLKMEKNNVRDLKRDPQLLGLIQAAYDEHAAWMNEQMEKLGGQGNALGLMYTGPLATSAQTAADNIKTIGTTAAIAFAEQWGPAWDENVDPLIGEMFEGTAEASTDANVNIVYTNEGLLERMLNDTNLNVKVTAVTDGDRAMGGPVKAGGTYLVGEQGPELLHMGANRSGNITPNHRLGGGPSVVVMDGRVVGQLIDERLGRGLVHRGGSTNMRST
jgi:hypothetical protein